MQTKELPVYAFMVACLASVIAGVWLAIATDNLAWLLLAAPVLLFLS